MAGLFKRFLQGIMGVVVVLALAAYAFPEARVRVAAWFSSATAELSEKPKAVVEPAVADELYTWVDKQGVTHYSQKPAHKKAEKVIYDGSRVTPLPEADAAVVERLKQIAGSSDEEEPMYEGASEQQGSQLLHGIRRELQANRDKMQMGKNGGAYTCDGRTHCSQMRSCEEAKYFLQHCPGVKMDGDSNGIPCEKQWCNGGSREGGRHYRR